MIDKIQENFYRISLPMPYRLRHVHVYVLVDGEEVLLFDTGLNMPGAYEKLTSDLDSIGLSPKSIRHIYLTHVHADHCGMAGLLQERTKAKIHLSYAADQVYQNFQKPDVLVRQGRFFYSQQGMSPGEVDAMVEEIEDMRTRMPQFQSDDLLQKNELRQFGPWQFEVIFTPGHADGHVCFFFRREGMLLAGDHVLPYIAPSLGPDIFNETVSPLVTYLESLRVVEGLPVTTIHPGHGISFTNLGERASEIRTHHELRKQVVLKVLNSRPKTTYAICAEIIGAAAANLDDWEKFMALNETYVYLLALKHENLIKEAMDNHVLVYTIV